MIVLLQATVDLLLVNGGVDTSANRTSTPSPRNRPVYLEHVSGHAATVNSAGLRVSGIV